MVGGIFFLTSGQHIRLMLSSMLVGGLWSCSLWLNGGYKVYTELLSFPFVFNQEVIPQ